MTEKTNYCKAKLTGGELRTLRAALNVTKPPDNEKERVETLLKTVDEAIAEVHSKSHEQELNACENDLPVYKNALKRLEKMFPELNDFCQFQTIAQKLDVLYKNNA